MFIQELRRHSSLGRYALYRTELTEILLKKYGMSLGRFNSVKNNLHNRGLIKSIKKGKYRYYFLPEFELEALKFLKLNADEMLINNSIKEVLLLYPGNLLLFEEPSLL